MIIALFTVNLKYLHNRTVKHRSEAISGTSRKTSWFLSSLNYVSIKDSFKTENN